MALNFMALFVAALVPLVIGFVWYNPKVFGNIWMKETGITPEAAKTANMPLIFGLSFVFALILAFAMNVVAIHDNFVDGAMFYATNKTGVPDAGSELAKWAEYYKTNLAASNHTFAHGAFHGFLIAGLFIAFPVIGTSALYENRGWKYIALTAGYWIVCLSIMGGIIAAWR